MKRFKQIYEQKRLEPIEEKLALISYAYTISDGILVESYLNEANVNDYLKKFGLKFHKEGPGLIDYIKDFVKGTGKIFVAALKGDEKEVKRIAQQVTKEKVLDFLLKLDAVTLHVITGPIHIVDALTGWDLWANVERGVEDAQSLVVDIWKAIRDLKDKLQRALDDRRKKSVLSCLNKIEGMVPAPQPIG